MTNVTQEDLSLLKDVFFGSEFFLFNTEDNCNAT